MKAIIFLTAFAFFSYSLALSAQNSGKNSDKLNNLQNQEFVKPEISNEAQKIAKPTQNNFSSVANQNTTERGNVAVSKTASLASKSNKTANPIGRLSFQESLEFMSDEEKDRLLAEFEPRLSQVEPGSGEEQKLITIINLIKDSK